MEGNDDGRLWSIGWIWGGALESCGVGDKCFGVSLESWYVFLVRLKETYLAIWMRGLDQ